MQKNLVLLALGVSLGAGVIYASKKYNKKPHVCPPEDKGACK